MTIKRGEQYIFAQPELPYSVHQPEKDTFTIECGDCTIVLTDAEYADLAAAILGREQKAP